MVKNGQNRPKSPSGGGGSGITVAGGLNPCGRERGRARARGCKRKLGVMSWGKGLINIGLEDRRNEEEEVKRREVAVFNFQSLFPRLRRGEPEPTATLSGDCELEEGTAVPQVVCCSSHARLLLVKEEEKWLKSEEELHKTE